MVIETSVTDGEIDSLATRSDLIVSLNGNQLEAGLSMLEEDICEPPGNTKQFYRFYTP